MPLRKQRHFCFNTFSNYNLSVLKFYSEKYAFAENF
jgi:hypothetical protein